MSTAIDNKRDTSFSPDPVSDDDLQRILPDDDEAPMGATLGHPAPPEEPQESSPRIPLEELVDWGRWKD